MWPNPQFPADFVTFTEEIVNGKLHFLRSATDELNVEPSDNAVYGCVDIKEYWPRIISSLFQKFSEGCCFQFKANLCLQSAAQVCLTHFNKDNTSMFLSNETNEKRKELVSFS